MPSERSQLHKTIFSDSIYMKFKNRWNQFMVVDVIKCLPGLGGGDSLKWKDYENVLCLILGGWLQNCQNLLNWTLNCAFYSIKYAFYMLKSNTGLNKHY